MNAMMPPKPKPSTSGTKNRPRPVRPSPVSQSPSGNWSEINNSIVSKRMVWSMEFTT